MTTTNGGNPEQPKAIIFPAVLLMVASGLLLLITLTVDYSPQITAIVPVIIGVVSVFYSFCGNREKARTSALVFVLVSGLLALLTLFVKRESEFSILAAVLRGGLSCGLGLWAFGKLSPPKAEEDIRDDQYVGPRCVSCEAPIEANVEDCPKCGWKQPRRRD